MRKIFYLFLTLPILWINQSAALDYNTFNGTWECSAKFTRGYEYDPDTKSTFVEIKKNKKIEFIMKIIPYTEASAEELRNTFTGNYEGKEQQTWGSIPGDQYSHLMKTNILDSVNSSCFGHGEVLECRITNEVYRFITYETAKIPGSEIRFVHTDLGMGWLHMMVDPDFVSYGTCKNF